MPTYSYRRADGTKFDIEQRITEPTLSVCPTTGQPVVRLITGGAGLVFKGTGFYQTDYARKKDGGAPGRSSSKSDESSGAKAEPKTESSSSEAAPKKAPTESGKSSDAS